MNVARAPDPPEVVLRRLERMTELRLSADRSASRAVAALHELARQLRRAEAVRQVLTSGIGPGGGSAPARLAPCGRFRCGAKSIGKVVDSDWAIGATGRNGRITFGFLRGRRK